MKRVLAAVTLASLFGIAASQAVLDWAFPEEVTTDAWYGQWKRCPDRPAERVNGRRAYWYCGTTEADSPRPMEVAAGATSRRTATRTARRGGRTAEVSRCP